MSPPIRAKLLLKEKMITIIDIKNFTWLFKAKDKPKKNIKFNKLKKGIS